MRNWNKWTKEDIEYLKNNYPNGESKGCIELHSKFTLQAIKYKAIKLGIKSNNFTKWSLEEESLLKESWKKDTLEKLLEKFPNRNYNQLMHKARLLGVKSETNRARKGSLEFLNQLNPKSCYWWGFVIADGHISHKGELAITLSNLDKQHLLKLSSILGCNISERGNFVHLRIGDKSFGEKWLNILSINAPKTYFPPDLSVFYTKEYLLPFIIGLIDGDGCIWENKNWLNLRIELHSNWLNTLQLISDKLKEFYDIDCKIKTSKRGFSQLNINTKKDLKILKDYISNVDYLERKWNKLSNL